MNKTKINIFEAAVKVFSHSGYNGATVDEIAKVAGVAKGTLYYHFKSKEEIFNFTIGRGLEILVKELETVRNADTDPINKLKLICKVQLSLLNDNKDFFKVILSQLWGQELRQTELRNEIASYISGIEGVLDEAKKEGLIRECNTAFISYTFFGSLVSAAIYELSNVDKVDLEETINSLTEIALKGILV